jgi:hypothetical protein
MFLCYGDESGFNGRAFNPDQPVQVVGAICPNVYNLHRTEDEFNLNMDILHQNNISVDELKAEQIYRGRGPWRNVHHRFRDQFIESYLVWIRDRKHTILISAVDNGKYFEFANSYPDHPCIQALPYPYLAGALHVAMMVQKMNRGQAKNKGRTILIFDEQKDFERAVADLIYNPPDFTDSFCNYVSGKDKARFGQIVDTAYFVSSHHSCMAQLADTISYITRLYFELNHYGFNEAYDGEREKINRWYQIIEDKHRGFNFAFPHRRGPFFDFLSAVAANGIRR